MLANRNEGFLEGGERDSERLDRGDGKFVEDEEGETETDSRAGWSGMAAVKRLVGREGHS